MVIALTDCSQADSVLVLGGKGKGLAELMARNFLVPQGFVVEAEIFVEFMSNLSEELRVKDLFEQLPVDCTSEQLEQTSKRIRQLIMEQELAASLTEEVLEMFHRLGLKSVAVRSSASVEDAKDASWAGQFKTFLQVGEAELLLSIKECWASLYTPQAITYARLKGVDLTEVAFAVVVQEMVLADAAGVGFSVDPVSGNQDKIVIEAVSGLGEAVVAGEVTPDYYAYSKSHQLVMQMNYGQDGGDGVLCKAQIQSLGSLLARIEASFGYPCDVEWALAGGEFYITQVRPITTLNGAMVDLAESVGQQLLDCFLRKTDCQDIYRMSFEFIPLFWTLPLYFYDKNMAPKLVPTLLIKDEQASYLYADAQDIFGALPEIILRHSAGDDKIMQVMNAEYEQGKILIDAAYLKALQLLTGTEQVLLNMLRDLLDVFTSFFTATSFTYLDQNTLAAVFKKKKDSWNVDRLVEILGLDIHKSFEYLKYEKLLEFKLSQTGLDNSLGYLFTTYSQVPNLTELTEFVGKYHDLFLESAILSKAQYLENNQQKFESLYKQLSVEEQCFVDFVNRIKLIREERKQYFSKLFQVLYLVSGALLKIWGFSGVKNGMVFAHELLRGREYIASNLLMFKKREQGYICYLDQPGVPSLVSFSGSTRSHLVQLDNLMLKANSGILRGQTAYGGRVEGEVVVAVSSADFSKLTPGKILVTSMTRPEILPYLNKVAGIITDEGGVTCHAAIIARELGIPCVIGTKIATTLLKNGQVVQLDANTGNIIINP